MTQALSAILALIQGVLPLINSGANTSLIVTIINALQKWLPLLVMEAETLYQPVKDIITALRNHDAVTEEQQASLHQLDAAMDAAFESAVDGIDPDAGDL